MLGTDVKNFVIRNPEIRGVELRGFGWGLRIDIVTNEKRYGWLARGVPGERGVGIEDYERMLRSVYSDRLFVSE